MAWQMKLSDTRRVVVFHYDEDENVIDFRHYSIKVKDVLNSATLSTGGGESGTVLSKKSLKQILRAKIPNLNKLNDISQYMLK